MGRIQQIQSFSTLDGPGTRCVVFLQGCPVGCLFCHNPDSWEFNQGIEMDVDELLRRIDRFRPFLPSSGLTISGGEPLAQPEFSLELATRAKRDSWHVALDTSGWGTPEEFERMIGQVDLVIFSIKHPLDPRRVSRVTAEDFQEKVAILARAATPVWVRYVVIPGWTDEPEASEGLKTVLAKLKNVEKVEILPYNSLAESKWQKLGWDSPIFHDPIRVDEEKVREFEKQLGLSRK